MSTIFDRLRQWAQKSVSLRILTILILTLLLLIPLGMVRELIRERSYRQTEAVTDIQKSWSYAQQVSGPVLSIPYTYTVESVDDKTKEITTKTMSSIAHFLPDQMEINAQLMPQTRERGIYEAILYGSSIELAGRFSFPNIDALDLESSQLQWDEAELSLGISDVRGIQEQVSVNINGQNFDFGPGLPSKQLYEKGIQTKIPIQPDEKGDWSFRMDLSLNGSESLAFVPVGKTTHIKVEAPWDDPKFFGDFLPDSHDAETSVDSFEAIWDVFHLNRDFPQQWKSSTYQMTSTRVGVELLQTIDEYAKNERTAKYAIMLISLTFMVFFFVEILQATRIHPIQYILVGLSLVIFFVLLLSMSEQIGFQQAYIWAAAAVILLITIYMAGIFKDLRATGITAGLLVIMYGFVFVILQLEDMALLVGSIGLFIVLGIVMLFTRNINWYQISRPKHE